MSWKLQKRTVVNNSRFRINPPTSVYQTQLFESFKDPTTLTWRLWHRTFIRCWAGTLENMANPYAIFTIRHPFYPSIWAYVIHVTLDTRLPLFLSCTLKRSGSLGTRLEVCITSCSYQWQRKACQVHSSSFPGVLYQPIGGKKKKTRWTLIDTTCYCNVDRICSIRSRSQLAAAL